MDEPVREPCPECAEPVALDARLCPHCLSSVLVDVHLDAPVPDARVRHAVARALQAMGPAAPSYSAAHSALEGPRPLVAQGVTRGFAQAAIDLLAEHGLRGEALRAPVPAVRSGLPPAVKAGAWGLLGLAALVAVWAVPRRPSAPAAPPSRAADPAVSAALTPR